MNQVAKTGGLAVLKNLTNDLTDMMLHLQQTIYSTGELGSVVNVETHSWPGIRRAAYAPVNALLGTYLHINFLADYDIKRTSAAIKMASIVTSQGQKK